MRHGVWDWLRFCVELHKLYSHWYSQAERQSFA
jgi:hypothetical protein